MEFAVVFAALFVGHSVGDHWVQTGHQAVCKGGPGWAGRWACAKHVGTLQMTKITLLAPAALLLDLRLTWWALALAFLIDGVSHYWADRRTTLEALARQRWVNKGAFYDQGVDLVNDRGEHAPHIGTGRYALDQSWHHLWLFASTVIAVAF